MKIVSIAPDVESGRAYLRGLSASGVEAVQAHYEIPPRVVEGEITEDVLEVAEKLAAAILEEVRMGAEIVTVACNTAALILEEARMGAETTTVVCNAPSLKLIFEIVEDRIENAQQEFRLVLTIPLIKKYLEMNPNKRIIVLGTMPLSEILAETEEIPTPANFEGQKREDLLELVQQIIWRVKAVQGSDTITAPIYNPPNDDKETLKERVLELDAYLRKLGVEQVMMGCTELPDAFNILVEELGLELPYELVDPATLVAEEIKRGQE